MSDVEIVRDGELVVALISAATHHCILDHDNECVVDREEVARFSKEAREFLRAWWSRKKPTLDMPNLK